MIVPKQSWLSLVGAEFERNGEMRSEEKNYNLDSRNGIGVAHVEARTGVPVSPLSPAEKLSLR